MNGTIHFSSLEELAEFLRHFTGSTASFEVRSSKGEWVLEFKGGF